MVDKSVNRLNNSWAYLKSWTDKNHELRGIISTYWDSSESVMTPHVMNHFPVIEGLCDLFHRFEDTALLAPIKKYADFYERVSEKDGLFGNAWGDVPHKQTGVVHQAASAGALLSAYRATNDERYLGLAVRNLKCCRERWPGLLLNGVVNQAMKYVQSILLLRELSCADYEPFACSLERYLKEFKALEKDANLGGTFFDQSYYRDFWMSCYEAKSLHGLLALYKADLDREWAKRLINQIVYALINNHYIGDGLFLSHSDYANSFMLRIGRKFFALARRIPWSDRGVRLEIIRRGLFSHVSKPVVHPYPIWVSRMADAAYIFNQVRNILDFDISTILHEMDSQLTVSQLPHGGVPNVKGPWMTGMGAWERSICSTRWNAYVFRYFALTSGHNVDLETPIFDEVVEWGDDFVTVKESPDMVEAIIHKSTDRYVWSKIA